MKRFCTAFAATQAAVRFVPRVRHALAAVAASVAILGLGACIEPPQQKGASSSGTSDYNYTNVVIGAAGDARVRLADVYQQIDGFGASIPRNSWTLADDPADLLFSPEKGAGLSLARIALVCLSIPCESWEYQPAHQAQIRGAKVWAAPWSPPASYKTPARMNGMDSTGACCTNTSLLPANYQGWANALAAFITAAKNNDPSVTIQALSVQNEPDYVSMSDSCYWEPAELLTFTRDFLLPAVAAVDPSVRIIAPETHSWADLRAYAQPFIDDATLGTKLTVLATHSYDAQDWFTYAEAFAAGKSVWQSGAVIEAQPDDTSMSAALRLATLMHWNLTQNNVSAWSYEYLVGSTGLLSAGGEATKRLWAFGNFSRFVRPGFVRVGVQGTLRAGVYVSAFEDVASGRLEVVAINAGSGSVSQRFIFDDFTAVEVTPFVTSADADLAEQPVVTAGSYFDFVLPAMSVTTFEGLVGVAE